MRKLKGVFGLTVMLTSPALMVAQDAHHDQDSRHYEDRAHHDSHDWNNNEDQVYRRYLEEHHKKYHEFEKASRREQNDYWNWRHAHPDNEHR